MSVEHPLDPAKDPLKGLRRIRQSSQVRADFLAKSPKGMGDEQTRTAVMELVVGDLSGISIETMTVQPTIGIGETCILRKQYGDEDRQNVCVTARLEEVGNLKDDHSPGMALVTLVYNVDDKPVDVDAVRVGRGQSVNVRNGLYTVRNNNDGTVTVS